MSTDDQNLDLQLTALSNACCERVFTDKMTGSRHDRPGLPDALSHLLAGDTLVVWKLDRLGRTVKGLVDLVADLESKLASAKRLLLAGSPPKDVARDLGVSVLTLYRWLPCAASFQ